MRIQVTEAMFNALTASNLCYVMTHRGEVEVKVCALTRYNDETVCLLSNSICAICDGFVAHLVARQITNKSHCCALLCRNRTADRSVRFAVRFAAQQVERCDLLHNKSATINLTDGVWVFVRILPLELSIPARRYALYASSFATFPTQYLRSSGFFGCPSDDLEHSSAFHSGPDDQCRQFQAFT